ncbi:UNVERIFIED_CONTAM: hypothetical protein FKN15_025092 [Acipenser sinensis]
MVKVFPDVTILFSDVVKFNEICIHITPMQVVDMLNEIYIVFDTLSEKHNVYKGMQIHISQTSKDHLEHEPYIIEERGKIFVKVTKQDFIRFSSVKQLNWLFNKSDSFISKQKRLLFIQDFSLSLCISQGKGYMKTYWLKGKKDLSFKSPVELRYSSEQRDSEEGSTKSQAKRSTSNLNNPVEQTEETKPSEDLPPDLPQPLEGAAEPPPAEPCDKERTKKTKNNKASKTEAAGANAQETAAPPTGPSENAVLPLCVAKGNDRHSRLTATLPLRSSTCCLL